MRVLRALVILCALLCIPLALVGTQGGTRALLWLAGRIAPVEIEYGAGSVAGFLHLRRVEIAAGGTRIAARDALVALDPACLWRSELCLRTLQIASLDIEVGDETGGDPKAGADASPLVFPLPVTAPRAHLDRLRVRWPGGSWSQDAASLALELRGSRLRLGDATVRRPRLFLETPQAPSAAGRAELPGIDLPLELDVRGLQLEDAVLRRGETVYPPVTLRLAGNWSGRRLRLQALDVEARTYGRLALRDGELHFDADWPLRAAAVVQIDEPAAWPALHGRRLRLEADGDLGNLQLRFSAPGVPALEGTARVDVLAPALTFDSRLRLDALEEVALPSPGDPPRALSISMLRSPLTLHVAGDIAAQDFALAGGAVTPAYGAVDIAATGRREGDSVLVDELAIADTDGDNRVTAAGTLDLGEALRWDLALDSPGLDLPPTGDGLRGRIAGNLRASGRFAQSELEFELRDIDLRGSVNGLPATIAGHLGIRDEALLEGSDLRARINGARLDLGPADDGRGGIRLRLAVDDLGRWLADASGGLRLSALIGRRGEHYGVEGEFSDLLWRGLAAGAGTVSGEYAPGRGGDFRARAVLSDISAAGADLDALNLQARGDPSRLWLRLESAGIVGGALEVTAEAAGEDWSGRLAPAAVTVGETQWSLSRAVRLDWSGPARQLRVEPHCWQHAGARLCAGAWRIGASGDGTLALTADASLLQPLMPAQTYLGGALRATASVQWDPRATVTGEAVVEASPLVLSRTLPEGERSEVHWNRVSGNLALTSDGLRVQAALYRGERAELTVALHPVAGREGELAGELQFHALQLDALSALLPQLSEFGGSVDGTLRLAGSRDHPRLDGTLTLDAGRLAVVGNPTRVRDLQLRLDARGDSAALSGRGLLGDGEFELSGDYAARPEPLLELRLQGRDQTVLYPPSTELRLSEDLSLRATREQITVGGEITVHDGIFQFEQLPEGGVALSDDVVRVSPTGARAEEALPVAVELDVRIGIEDGFRLTGSLLESSLSGNLQLRKKPRQPIQLYGSLDTPGGYVRAYDRLLVIKRGVISFSGNPDNPVVDLRAERRVSGSDVTAGIHVHGALADNLSLDVYSEPPMSQGNAMSYLIWGRGLDTGGTGDGAVLALSLAGSVVNRSSLVSTINKVPGISDVAFGAQGSEEDAAATVSGYIGERIYLSYGLGITEPINVVTARLFLQTRLWLEVVSRIENSLDLYYSFDID